MDHDSSGRNSDALSLTRRPGAAYHERVMNGSQPVPASLLTRSQRIEALLAEIDRHALVPISMQMAADSEATDALWGRIVVEAVDLRPSRWCSACKEARQEEGTLCGPCSDDRETEAEAFARVAGGAWS